VNTMQKTKGIEHVATTCLKYSLIGNVTLLK
jgi:hypothetical protein